MQRVKRRASYDFPQSIRDPTHFLQHKRIDFVYISSSSFSLGYPRFLPVSCVYERDFVSYSRWIPELYILTNFGDVAFDHL